MNVKTSPYPPITVPSISYADFNASDYAAQKADSTVFDLHYIEKTATEILKLIFSCRRLLPQQQEQAEDFATEAAPHLSGIKHAILHNQPIELVLPGFPAKSPNRNKTLGPLPDLAEKHALKNLVDLCDQLRSIYPPGAHITICSDGRVFSDLVRIPDADVSAYGQYLKRYCADHFGDTFSFFDLDDVYEEIRDFDIMREELLIHYGESICQLRQRCKNDKELAAMYKGITRFLFEDYSGMYEFCEYSSNHIQKRARLVAYRVIQRSNAWTRLIAEHFSHAVRLSVHPQFRVSNKIGIYLGSTRDCWLTPWHAVAVKRHGEITLMKRSTAEQQGLLAFEEGRPSHFEIIEGK